MENREFALGACLTGDVEKIVKGAVKVTLTDQGRAPLWRSLPWSAGRRPAGVKAAMERTQENRLIFGASVTATTANLKEITSKEFFDELRDSGCKAVIYVEFVPVTEESRDLAPGDAERDWLRERLAAIREEYPETVFISFPGDEKSSSGCVLFERRETVDALWAQGTGKREYARSGGGQSTVRRPE